MKPVRIGKRLVGPGRPVYVIAEIGSNHDGSLAQALRLIKAAANAGADAVKFQSIVYDRIWVPALQSAAHRRFWRKCELPEAWYPELKRACAAAGVDFLSAPIYDESIDALEAAGVPAYKVASPQVRANLPLVAKIARKGKPLILSTGYCDVARARAGIEACRRAGNGRIIVLHCVSEYPTAPRELRLRVMQALGEEFGVPYGLSDHTMSPAAAVAATALGACVIEKHFTLSRRLPGPDHPFAAEPDEFAEMVRLIRETQAMMSGGDRRTPTPGERRRARALQLRLIAARDLPAGGRPGPSDFILRRAAYGIPAEERPARLKLAAALPAGRPLERRHILGGKPR